MQRRRVYKYWGPPQNVPLFATARRLFLSPVALASVVIRIPMWVFDLQSDVSCTDMPSQISCDSMQRCHGGKKRKVVLLQTAFSIRTFHHGRPPPVLEL